MEFLQRAPAIEEQADQRLARPAAQITGKSAWRVLIADDNRDGAESMATLLRIAGHEVHTAHSGREALDIANQRRPGIVVLDIGMPDMNGYDVARHLRREPWGTRATLVALTGWARDADKERACAAGFDHYLTKPVDPEQLEALIASLEQ